MPSFHPHLRGSTVRHQSRRDKRAGGGEEAWQFGWDQYKASDVASERDSLLSALTCAEEVWLLNR